MTKRRILNLIQQLSLVEETSKEEPVLSSLSFSPASHATLASLTAELETLVTRLDRGLVLIDEEKDPAKQERLREFWAKIDAQYRKASGELDTVLAAIEGGDKLYCPTCARERGEEMRELARLAYGKPCTGHQNVV